MVEVVGAKQSLEFVDYFKWAKVLVETDCINLLSSLNLVVDTYISRNLNAEAHNLARAARMLGSRTWHGDLSVPLFPSS